MTASVSLTLADGIASVTLSHPGKLNAMPRAMWRALRLVFKSIQQDPHMRCVLMAGEVGHFCAGGDMPEHGGGRYAGHTLRELTVREMLLSAAVLDAAEMKQRGFLNAVVPGTEARAVALACAGRVSRLGAQAARLNKQSIRAIAQYPCTRTATNLVANSYRYAASPEHREGVMAFVEKRQPQFER